jgi:hypothetical protein
METSGLSSSRGGRLSPQFDEGIREAYEPYAPPVLKNVMFRFCIQDVTSLEDIASRLGFDPSPPERSNNSVLASLGLFCHETVETFESLLTDDYDTRLHSFVMTTLSPHRDSIRSFTTSDPEVRSKWLDIHADLDCAWTFESTLDPILMGELAYMGCEISFTYFHSAKVSPAKASS